MTATPVTIVSAGGYPVTNVPDQRGAVPMTVVDALGEPVTLVDAGGEPVTLLNADGTLYSGSGPAIPVLTLPVATVLDQTTAQLNVTTTVGSGDLYVAVTTSATQPTEAQIIAGQDHTGAAAAFAHSQGIGSSGVQEIFGNATGLIAATTYFAHFIQVAGTGSSNISSTVSFVPADVSAPILTSFEAFENGSAAWTGTLNTDTAEGTLDVVITTSATAPTADQIIAGQDHTGAAAASRVDSQAVTTTGPQALSGAGLSDDTTFWAHATQTDVAGNKTTPVTSSTSFTTDDATVLYSFLQTGAHDMGFGIPAGFSVNATGFTDAAGGSNAVEYTNLGNAATLRLQNNIIYNNGLNVVRCEIRVTNAGGSIITPVTLRIRPLNVTDVGTREYNLTTGAVSAGGADASIANLGGGWFRCTAQWDMTGDADLNGTITFEMLEANSVAGDMRIAMHDITLSII